MHVTPPPQHTVQQPTHYSFLIEPHRVSPQRSLTSTQHHTSPPPPHTHQCFNAPYYPSAHCTKAHYTTSMHNTLPAPSHFKTFYCPCTFHYHISTSLYLTFSNLTSHYHTSLLNPTAVQPPHRHSSTARHGFRGNRSAKSGKF